jgi:hypothetical protein
MSFFDEYPALFFILFWLFVTGLISVLTGWYSLSRKHPFKPGSTGAYHESFMFNTVHVNMFAKYSICMNISIYENGLKIVPFFLFRFMHPPVFFRWSELSNMQMNEMWMLTRLDFDVSGRTLSIYGSAARAVAAHDKWN